MVWPPTRKYYTITITLLVLTHDEEQLEHHHDVHPQVVTGTGIEMKINANQRSVTNVPGLHGPDSAPVGGEEVSGDEETDEVADDDDTDDEVEVYEFRCEYEHYIRIVFCPQEASISAHIGEDRATGPVSINQSCH